MCRVQPERTRNCGEEGKNSFLSEELRAAVAGRHEACQAGVEHGQGAGSARSNSCQVRQEHRDSNLSGKRVSFL